MTATLSRASRVPTLTKLLDDMRPTRTQTLGEQRVVLEALASTYGLKLRTKQTRG